MAKPTYYPDWANNDVLLPTTGKTNKVRPREIIRTTGWDKGQIPTAEEMNWTLNNLGAWIHYFADEFIPTLPNLYLPRTGTQATLSGHLSGTITWNGSNVGTGSITVLDNSHRHVSSNITDATNYHTPNVIVKRDGNGGANFARTLNLITDGSYADLNFLRSTDQGRAGCINYSQVDNLFQMYMISNTGTSVVSYLGLKPGFVEMNNPRSTTGQEGQPNSLVRFDYLSTQVTNLNNGINNAYQTAINVNNDLQNYKNVVNATFVSSLRLGARQTFKERDLNERMGGGVMTSWADYGSSNYWQSLRPLQYYIGGNWYTAGYQ